MTTDTENIQDQNTPPATLVEQVKDALENLYDLNYLEHHPLAQGDECDAEHPSGHAGQRLRLELVGAIESLSPGPSVSFDAPQTRVHNLLVLHYVECRTVQEAAHMTDISRRQAHRDLRLGVEKIAAIFWARRSTTTSQQLSVSQLSSVETEVARLETHPSPTDMCRLLQEARETVGRLAAQHAVQFQIEAPMHPVMISVDQAVAEQVMVNLLSNAIQQAQPGALRVALTSDAAQASLTVCYLPEATAGTAPPVNLVIAQMADQLGWVVRRKDLTDGTRIIALNMTTYGPSVLVIDDNEGLVKLVDRYLTDQACRVISAENGLEGLRLAQEELPDVVILDVMIPQVHGWEVLQRLRNHPGTARIPVIICSVINDPELAYSLGASLFLPKPVSRNKILNALHELDVL
jgi:CheY-like chemotaxis protein